jgi:hypothetical protein
MPPQSPPKSVVNFIINNMHNNQTTNQLNLGGSGTINQTQANQQTHNVQHQTNAHNIQHQNIIAGALGIASSASLSDRINTAMGTEGITWQVNNGEKSSYQLVPNTRECCVAPGHVHTSDNHSCIYVYKSSVVCNCFSHGKKTLEGNVSRLLREIFFDFTKSKGVMVKIVHHIYDVARVKGYVRENGCVLKRIDNTHQYEYVDKYEDFISKLLKDNIVLLESPRRFNDLMIFMNKIRSVDFPIVKQNRRYIGFSNGILDIFSGELVENNFLEHV